MFFMDLKNSVGRSFKDSGRSTTSFFNAQNYETQANLCFSRGAYYVASLFFEDAAEHYLRSGHIIESTKLYQRSIETARSSERSSGLNGQQERIERLETNHDWLKDIKLRRSFFPWQN